MNEVHARVGALLERTNPSRAEVDVIALALYDWQILHNPVYAAIADGARPTRVTEIPVVPVSLFQELDLVSFPLAEAEVVFLTSGTTGARRGRHAQKDTRLYDLAAPRFFRRMVGDAPGRVCSLCPSEAHSSLGHMVARLGDTVWQGFSAEHGVSPETWSKLDEGPAFLACTAFALDALLQHPGQARLDPRSLVMVTGGFKGRVTRLDAPALYEAIPERLGAPRVVAEYGMTELSSQLWSRPVPAGALPGPFVAPPWLRVYAADPDTGAPVRGVGVLRFVDLLNVWSVLAIETMDLGEVVPGPDGDVVTLHGRATGAELRGCSLRAEDFLGRAR